MRIFIYNNRLNLTNYVNAIEKLKHDYIFSDNINKAVNCDFLILTGGGDIYPPLYNKKPLKNTNYSLKTDFDELNLLRLFIKLNKPVLGICKGMQIINVYFDGTLKNIKGHEDDSGDIFHKITWENNLDYVKNKPTIVNSSHHQAIDRLGNDLEVCAVSKDGIIESVKHKTKNIVGEQLHPERLSEKVLSNFLID